MGVAWLPFGHARESYRASAAAFRAEYKKRAERCCAQQMCVALTEIDRVLVELGIDARAVSAAGVLCLVSSSAVASRFNYKSTFVPSASTASSASSSSSSLSSSSVGISKMLSVWTWVLLGVVTSLSSVYLFVAHFARRRFDRCWHCYYHLLRYQFLCILCYCRWYTY